MQKNKILITCAKGIPPFLKQELLTLGFPVLSESIAGIETEGTLDDTQRLNLQLRTAHRVLFVLGELSAADADGLYRELRRMPWEALIPADGYLCVTSSVETPSIRDPRFASLRCKDAIVDRIKEKAGRRPDSGPERDRSVVHLYWKEQKAVVYLDTSGESLSRRGYRKIPMAAPMQETLAASVVLATGWQGGGSFVNPMCGSGTLAIEAALIALDRAPGLLRGNFGFMHVPGYNEALWSQLREKARQGSKKQLAGRIIATDIDPDAVEGAKKNAATAGVEHLIDFQVCDFAGTPVPEGGGVIVMNPEYGERMGEAAALEPVYKGIGDFLKQKCQGFRGYVFTGNAALGKKVGLKPKRSIPFWNSGIECRLLEFDLYAGSKKAKKTKGAE
jgi:putative N6-adenine-specific DNA methylase